LTTNSSIASPGLEPDGRTELRLTPLELIERLAALIPPPRLHRHRYHGVLAPNSPQCAQVTALARPPTPPSSPPLPPWRSRPAPRALARAHPLGAAAGAHLPDLAPALRPWRSRSIALPTRSWLVIAM
jgi:hypothetical protein